MKAIFPQHESRKWACCVLVKNGVNAINAINSAFLMHLLCFLRNDCWRMFFFRLISPQLKVQLRSRTQMLWSFVLFPPHHLNHMNLRVPTRNLSNSTGPSLTTSEGCKKYLPRILRLRLENFGQSQITCMPVSSSGPQEQSGSFWRMFCYYSTSIGM